MTIDCEGSSINSSAASNSLLLSLNDSFNDSSTICDFSIDSQYLCELLSSPYPAPLSCFKKSEDDSGIFLLLYFSSSFCNFLMSSIDICFFFPFMFFWLNSSSFSLFKLADSTSNDSCIIEGILYSPSELSSSLLEDLKKCLLPNSC